ncbi:MAG: MaoC family dehydratase N-terminal domain-containing protein [Pseudomonadota bacterium]
MTADAPFRAWIGKTDVAVEDTISTRLLNEFRATLGPAMADVVTVPPGLHWCLAPPTAAPDQLGVDGHPAKGGFLPPIPLPRRMWAGGEITFLGEFAPHELVTKTAEITDIQNKTGKSGSLCFVTVQNTYSTASGPVIRDTQNIVYREAATEVLPVPDPIPQPNDFDVQSRVDVSEVTLFRYSALTFNAHRIHFDQAYAREAELYPDLVIHGPLQATYLLNFATRVSGLQPHRFSYRGLSPAIGVQRLTLGACTDGKTLHLSVHGANGHKTMQAIAHW